MQTDNIIDKAKRLGLDTGNSDSVQDNLRHIAQQVGLENFNSLNDLDKLENLLDTRLQEQQNTNDVINNINSDDIYSSQRIPEEMYNNEKARFGEKEYNQAKGKDGVYDKNYYANREKDLAKKEEEAKEEKERNFKKKEDGPINADGPNTRNKNIIDKAKDNINLVKAKNDRFQNKLSDAKAKAFNAMHPEEYLKDKAKSAVSDATNKVKDKAKKAVGDAAKKAGKAVGDGAKAVGQAIIKFVASNPLAIGIVLVVAFVLLLLLFFAANDIENSSLYSDNCDAISLKTTSLSRSEFITKVESYFTDTSAASYVFATNAGEIYDIAERNDINPEIIVVRAILEGFSPGSSKNNYWGLNCTNTGGYDACFSYDSFSEGVMGFIRNIVQYETASDMMQKYAYIGSYWYNPGSSSIGGCYYYPYIEKYLSASRKEEVKSICQSSKSCTIAGGESCIATTEEDQTAYAKYQVEKMTSVRERVFGIPQDNCLVGSGDCVLYAQSDNRWGSKHLGNSSATMSNSGCAVTSIAIGISCSGVNVSTSDFDAGVLIDKLNAGNCFTGSGAIYWGCSAINEIAPAVKYVGSFNVSSFTSEEKQRLIESYDANSYFVLTHFRNSVHPRGHYVVFDRTHNNSFTAKDPAGGKITVQLFSDVDQVVVYQFNAN